MLDCDCRGGDALKELDSVNHTALITVALTVAFAAL